MAKARKIKTVRYVTKKIPVDRIQLDLSDGEVDLLRTLLDYVGGSPTDSPRKYADRMIKALDAAGVPQAEEMDANNLIILQQGTGVTFRNYGSDDPVEDASECCRRGVARLVRSVDGVQSNPFAIRER
jgi:hypothetical protein